MFDVKKIAIYKVDYIIKVVTVGEQGSDRSFFTADARRLMRMDEKGDRYFTINFIPHFTIPVGAGSPRYLTPIDKLSKPAPTPPKN